MRYITYLIYIIIWELMTIGGSVYLVVSQHESLWWLVFGFFLSTSAYNPSSWSEISLKLKQKDGNNVQQTNITGG